jgi:hypothetical protein
MFFMAPEKIGKADWSYLYTYGTCRTACQGWLLISRRTVRSQRSMGIPGPISTVHDELMGRELAELA